VSEKLIEFVMMNKPKMLFIACLLFSLRPPMFSAEKPEIGAKDVTPSVVGAVFALSVADVERTASWYCENLGFHVNKKGQIADSGMEFALLSRPGALLEIIKFKAAKTRAAWGLAKTEVHEVHGIFKIGFEVTDIDALFNHAKERGLQIFFPIVQARDIPLRTFGLTDPEGNIIQIFGK
jgi:predicted enzyme related to lactoylglutathione lyase